MVDLDRGSFFGRNCGPGPTVKDLLQDVGSRFFNFIIFLATIILEKLEMLEIYRKNQIIYFSIKKTIKL